jgi:hypothetical protein
MDFRIILPRRKEKHKKKKFFSRNTPPGFDVSVRGKTQSL